MVVLKKIKSASLVEALIATILIVVIFVVASLVINNLLLNNFSNNTHQVETHLNELEYQCINKQLTLPYHEHFNNWDIDAEKTIDITNNINWIQFRATKTGVKNGIIRKRKYEK